MKQLSIFLLLAPLFFACNSEKKIYDEVMAVHDEVMPLMDNIMTMKQDLKDRAKQLAKDTLTDHQQELAEVQALIEKLDSADRSMMVWMREFHHDYESVAKEELTDYLEKQKKRITAVGLFMREAIKDAEDYFSE